jgi:hypothetical protein
MYKALDSHGGKNVTYLPKYTASQSYSVQTLTHLTRIKQVPISHVGQDTNYPD